MPTIRIAALFLISMQVVLASDQPKPLGVLIDVGGQHLHQYCTGTGSPTVMVVGGAFSFDWALVQEPVARFTRICTYDPSGTAWSDSVPQGKALSCIDRVEEIHRLQQASNLQGPYILVGYSIGGLYARLYAQRYPQDVLGIMLVDHAFTDVAPDANLKAPVSPNGAAAISARR